MNVKAIDKRVDQKKNRLWFTCIGDSKKVKLDESHHALKSFKGCSYSESFVLLINTSLLCCLFLTLVTKMKN